MALNRNFIVKQGIQVGANINVASTFTSNTFLSEKVQAVRSPNLYMDFTKGLIDSRVQIQRASQASYLDANNKIQVVAANTARLDYELGTGRCLGMLIEEGRTNLINYSDIEGIIGQPVRGMNSYWAGNSHIVSTEQWIGPNQVSAKHTWCGDSNIGYFSSMPNATIGYVYTASVYVYIPSTSNILNCYIALEGAAGFSGAGSANISLRDQWQRIKFTATATGAGSSAMVLRIDPANATQAYANNDCVVYSDCWQLESGSYASTWIPTTNVTSASRPTEVPYVTPISDFYNPVTTTIYGEFDLMWTGSSTFRRPNDALNAPVYSVGGFDQIEFADIPSNQSLVTTYNGYGIALLTDQIYTEAWSRYGQVGTGSVWGDHAINYPNNTYAQANTLYKVAGSFSTANTSLSINGSATTTPSNGGAYRSEFQNNRMYIGYRNTGSNSPYSLGGHMKRFAYYPAHLSLTELAALTEI